MDLSDFTIGDLLFHWGVRLIETSIERTKERNSIFLSILETRNYDNRRWMDGLFNGKNLFVLFMTALNFTPQCSRIDMYSKSRQSDVVLWRSDVDWTDE